MLSDVCLRENKGFEVLLDKPVCCTFTPRVVWMWLLLGLWGETAPPIQTVQGLWHLTFHVFQLCTVQKNAKRKKENKRCRMINISQVMICRNIKGKTVALPTRIKNSTKRCWKPNDTNSKVTWSPSMLKLDWNVVLFFFPKGLSKVVSRFPPSVHIPPAPSQTLKLPLVN